MTEKHHILLVEDEVRIAALLRDYFLASGITLTHVADGQDAVAVFSSHVFDLVLLDINLPHVAGTEICCQIRQFSTVPIIMLSALNSETDRLYGLTLEADDYIGKPFSPREVVAKVQALLRRSKGEWRAAELPLDATLLTLDEASYEARLTQEAVTLTKIEFALLKTLSQQPGRIYSRNQLMNAMYGDFRIVSERTIDSHIKKLRKKLKLLAQEMEMIESSYGAGYRFTGQGVRLRGCE